MLMCCAHTLKKHIKIQETRKYHIDCKYVNISVLSDWVPALNIYHIHLHEIYVYIYEHIIE